VRSSAPFFLYLLIEVLRMQDGIRDRMVIWMGAVLCLALLLPNHYSPWVTFHQQLVTAVAFLPLMVWSCLQRPAPPALAYGAAALALVPLLQMATGHLYFAGDGWMSILYLLGFALAVHAGSCCVQTEVSGEAQLTRMTALWVGLVVAGFISVAIAAHQWLMLGRLAVFVVDAPPNGRPFANLAQPNHLATLLLLGIAGMTFLWESGRLRAATNLAGIALLTIGLVMTGSRSVFLTVAWLIPAYFLLRRRCRLRTTPAAFGLVLALYLLAALNWQTVNDILLLASDVSTAVDRMSQPGIRKVYWMSMIDAIGRSPWVGYGWGQIGIAQTATALDYPATHEFFDSSHNLVIDLALWAGLPFALLSVVGLALWFSWQARRCSNPLSWVTLVAIGMVFSHAMVEYPLSYAYFLLPVGLWMGALTATYPSAADRWMQRWSGSFARVTPVAVGLAALPLFVVVVVEYLPYEEDWRSVRFREVRIGDLTPKEPPPRMLLTNINDMMRFARVKDEPQMPAHELDWMRKVSERYAYASLMYKYALAQGLNGEPEGAGRTLAKLCKMHTQAACDSARREWSKLAHERYPELAKVPFSQAAH
jgi:hypothetical protein